MGYNILISNFCFCGFRVRCLWSFLQKGMEYNNFPANKGKIEYPVTVAPKIYSKLPYLSFNMSGIRLIKMPLVFPKKVNILCNFCTFFFAQALDVVGYRTLTATQISIKDDFVVAILMIYHR